MRNQTILHMITNNTTPRLDDKITKKKNQDLCENHLFKLK